MFGIGETELVIIVVFAFLLFGPDKLPGMGRTLGRVLRQFREASDGFSEVVQTNIMDPAAEELQKSPKQRRREEAEQHAEAAPTEDAPEATDEAAPRAEQAPRRETFAERKARLQAERKAAEAAKTADAAAAPVETGEEAPEAAGAGTQGPDAAPDGRTSAADLYAMGSRHSSRYKAREEAAAADADGADADGAQEPGESSGEGVEGDRD